jgi:hypothetical protein
MVVVVIVMRTGTGPEQRLCHAAHEGNSRNPFVRTHSGGARCAALVRHEPLLYSMSACEGA